ncbi:MAG TPA: hypothetical protein VF758_01645 [Candidatus Acidoferrum sp.]
MYTRSVPESCQKSNPASSSSSFDRRGVLGALLGAAAALMLPEAAPGAPGTADGPLTADEAWLLTRLQALVKTLTPEAFEALNPSERKVAAMLHDVVARTEARLKRYGVAGGARG